MGLQLRVKVTQLKRKGYYMLERIQLLMIANGVRKPDFIKAIGVSSGNFSDWNAGRSSPRLETAIKIADYFNVSLDYLCGRDDKFPSPSPDAFELVKIYDKLSKEGKTVVLGEAYKQKQIMEGMEK